MILNYIGAVALEYNHVKKERNQWFWTVCPFAVIKSCPFATLRQKILLKFLRKKKIKLV